MASRSTSLTFDLYAKDKTASSTFDRFGRNVSSTDTKVSKLGSTFSKFGKMAATGIAVGVAAAGVALVAFGKSAVEEAREAQKVAGQTEAVIKSTGQAAHVTADQVADLASQLSMKAGIDDELIQSGENVLLTFTNIRNEVGKGNDVFDQATTTALDMSVALGKDMKGASILVGKALNDPIAGLSALTRVGVQFTDQQEANITKLVEEGNTLKAQKIILGELDKKFAGSAAAQATAGEKAKVAWENFQEQIGKKLLPLLDKLAVFFVATLIPLLQRFAAWFQHEVIPAITRVVSVLRTDFLPVLQTMGQFLLGQMDVLKPIAGFLLAYGAGIYLVIKAMKAWVAIQKAVVAIQLLVAATNPLALIVIGLAALGVALVIAYKKSETFRKIVQGAFAGVRAVVETVVKVATALWTRFGDSIITIAKAIWTVIAHTFKNALQILRGLMDIGMGLIKGDWSQVWQGIKEVLGAIWDQIKTVVKFYLTVIRTVISAGWNLVKDITRNIWDTIKSLIGDAMGKLWDVIKAGFEKIKGVFKDAFEAVAKMLRGWIAGMVSKFLGFVQTFLDAADKAFGWIPGIDDKLDAAQAAFARFREKVNASIRGIDASKSIAIHIIPDKKFDALVASGAGHPAWTGNRATGGPIIQGPPGRDWGNYRLMRGEHVWTTDEVKKAGGHGTMFALREMAESGALKTLVGMAKGGPVGGVQTGPVPEIVGADKAAAKIGAIAGFINSVLANTVMLVKESAVSAGSGNVRKAIAWARTQIGKPYNLGGVGPGSYDCSGFMSAITNVIRGDPIHTRLGSTATFPWRGFVAGADPGGFTIGSAFRYPGSSFGHMAGTLGGVNVESRGGDGVVVGRNARGYRDPGFTQVYHLIAAMKGFKGGGSDTGALSKAERNIIRVESGGSVFANNPTSTAFGLGQLLESNRVAYARRLGFPVGIEYGDTGTTNRAHQLAMMRAYIHDRYGTAAHAWNFWQQHHWYGKGLKGGIFNRPTMIGVGDRGPERVDVTPLAAGRGGRGRRLVLEGPVRIDIGGHRLDGVIRGIVREELEDEFAYQAGG